MPKSKNRKEHKTKVQKFKNKNTMSQQNQQVGPEPIRQVPVWKSQDPIEMNGLEFEAIYNFINSVQGAYAAVQSIMNKNIISGKVQLNFEKLNETKTDYVPMSEEEQAPHKAEFQKVLDAAKAQAASMVKRQDYHLEPDSQEGVPHLDGLVDANGQPVSS